MILPELQVDGLVGPTHHYAGLARGNLASATHAHRTSAPRAAALEGLRKMRTVADLGVPQMVLPPPERPDLRVLRRLGFAGSETQVLARAAREAPRVLAAASSASAMWAANAATVAPSADTRDGRVHLTPANLVSTLHRSLEPPHTARALARLFPGEGFVVHDPLPATAALSDEGAANHTRLAGEGAAGIHLFVYGRSALERGPEPARFPARQTLEASHAIARRHTLDPACTVFAQQEPDAIDRGVFHNDVIAVGHGSLLLFHARAWRDADAVVAHLERLTGGTLVTVRLTDADLPVDEAVRTYLFNSQLLTGDGGRTVLLAPVECEQSDRARGLIEGLVADGRIPIDEARYLDVRQSMQNGGGPACLRLRVPVTEAELGTVHAPCRLDAALHARLEAWVERHYRDRLAPDDLADPALLDESRRALDELTALLALGPDFYPFQR